MTTQLDWNSLYNSGKEYRTMNLLLLDKILSHVPETGSDVKTALDIGCGTGDLAVKLAKRGYQVTGIDLSDVAIDQARKRAADQGVTEKTEFLAANIAAIGASAKLPGQPFDLITCKLVYAFVEDRPALLKMVHDLLKPTGTFVLITPVLYPGIEYGPRLKCISVDFATTQDQLRRHFKNVQIVHEDYLYDLGSEPTFVANEPLELGADSD